MAQFRVQNFYLCKYTILESFRGSNWKRTWLNITTCLPVIYIFCLLKFIVGKYVRTLRTFNMSVSLLAVLYYVVVVVVVVVFVVVVVVFVVRCSSLWTNYSIIYNLYIKTKDTLLRTNAAILYSRLYRAKRLAPKFAQVLHINTNCPVFVVYDI